MLARQIFVNITGSYSKSPSCRERRLFRTKIFGWNQNPIIQPWVKSNSTCSELPFSELTHKIKSLKQQHNLPVLPVEGGMFTKNEMDSPSKVILNFQKLMSEQDGQIELLGKNSDPVINDAKLLVVNYKAPILLTGEDLGDENQVSSCKFPYHTQLLDDEEGQQYEHCVESSIVPTSSTRKDIETHHRTEIKQEQPQSPNMTIYQYKSTEEAYFQWDYRNHHEIRGTHRINIITKIERTLHNAHLEPYGKQRGVDTVRNNILNFDIAEKFRLGRNKSLEKGKISSKSTRNGVVPDYDKMRQRMKRLLRPMPLLRSILKIIYERHAIYASGCTEQIASLDPFCLGESFFGPETNIRIDYDTARIMLRELWLHGHSGRFNKYQKNHDEYQERMKERNYRPKLTDD